LEELIVRKLTFERAVLIVFILIILISTSDITGKYYNKFIRGFNKPIASDESRPNMGFPTMLMNADKLYREGNYEGAAKEYLTMTLNNTLSIEQKNHAYFRLGICQYNLKNFDLAVDNFNKVVSLNPNDSVAYNNAAVSAYRSKDVIQAIKLQQRALEILPIVEYYYNLARIYEDNEDYEMAANNYLVVAKGEQNITQTDRIDPVRVKEKIVRLIPKDQVSVSQTINNVLIALQLKDSREILTISENEMEIKQGDFIVNVENHKSYKNIVAEYSREKLDPYNLISEVIWTILKDGKQLYKKSGDKINAKAVNSGDYEVRLSIKYNGNKEMISSKTVRISEAQSTINNGSVEQTPTIVNNRPTKTYEYAIYEQLFDSGFDIRDIGYIDKYSVVWGKDNVHTQLVKSELDNSNCLIIRNESVNDEGIWLNLDSLIKQANLYGERVNIRFFARKITENGNLDVKARARTEEHIILTQRNFELDFRWKEYNMYVTIPESASGLTISIKTEPGQEYKLDTFLLVD
jgi:tetratricopeptide (TPR) repeat protein